MDNDYCTIREQHPWIGMALILTAFVVGVYLAVQGVRSGDAAVAGIGCTSGTILILFALHLFFGFDLKFLLKLVGSPRLRIDWKARK